MHYIYFHNSMVLVYQSESLPSTEFSSSLTNSLVRTDISSCQYFPHGSSLVPVSSYSVSDSRVKTPAPNPST